jgi:hypothetical protein
MRLSRWAVLSTSLWLTACFEFDNVLADMTPIVDSVSVAVARGPGTSGKLRDLLNGSWKMLIVLDPQTPTSQVVDFIGEESAKEFREIVARDTAGTVLVFHYMHGSMQSVFIPRARATFAPEVLGHSHSHFGAFVIDSARQFAIRPAP